MATSQQFTHFSSLKLPPENICVKSCSTAATSSEGSLILGSVE